MTRYTTFSIEVAGRRYAGDWSIQDKEVVVGSAYGSGRARYARAKPENVAARVLREIVEARP